MSFDVAAQQVQDRLKAVHQLVKQIHEERAKHEPTLNTIAKTKERLQNDEKNASYYKSKLKTLYTTTLNDYRQDEELVRSALAKIYEIRAIRNERRINARLAGNKETIRRGALMKMLQTSAQTLPLWVSPVGEEAPSLCGCIPADHSYIAKVGDMVAALVRSSDGDENWILAEVVTYLSGSGRYEVDDIDEEQKERHALSRRRVIPLPLYRANPETDSKALFSKGATVMALYPQTTCFYKAVVNALPANHTEEYQVLFEDSSYADGFSPPLMVAQRYVIALKDKKAKL